MICDGLNNPKHSKASDKFSEKLIEVNGIGMKIIHLFWGAFLLVLCSYPLEELKTKCIYVYLSLDI
jgi:hypothetical protein